jgi:autotransporter-associated beta strand protein
MRNNVMKKRAAVLMAAIGSVALAGRSANATTYAYAGPYSQSATNFQYNPLSNAASWGGNAPVSAIGTVLNFNNIDSQSFTVANDGGNSFNLSGLTVSTWSSSTLNLASNSPESTNPGSFQLVGTAPAINISGPGSVVFGGFASQPGVTPNLIGYVANAGLTANTGTGLIVSAITTINQTGNSTLTLGATQNSSTGLPGVGGVGISGTGGFIINGVPDSVVNFASPNGTAFDSSFSGGVTLNSGILQIGGGSTNTTIPQGPALGTGALNVSGGILRALVTGTSASPIANLSNPIVINGTNLNISAGTFNLTGNISGTLATDGLHLFNAYAGTPGPIYVTLTGTDSYSGPTTIDNAAPNRYQGTFGNQLYTTLVVGSGGSLTNTSSINLGSNSTLALTAGASGLGIPSTAPLNLSNATVSITPSGSTQTYNLTGGTFSGGNIFSLASAGNSGAVNTFNFSSPTFQSADKPTLFFGGNWQSTTSVASTKGQAFFGSTGLATASDSNYSGAYPVVPFATGCTVAPGGVGSTSANAFVSYNATNGLTLVPFTDSTNVTQFVPANNTSGPAVTNQFNASNFTSGTNNVLLNFYNWNTGTGTFYTTYNLSGTANVYALAASYTAVVKGGTLNVTSGVIASSGISGNLTFNSSTVAFGNNTGYLFSNGAISFSTGSSITGNAGLVVNGAGATAGGGTVTFSSGNTSNPFKGGLYIENGDVTYTNDASLGVTYNALSSLVDGTITLNGGYLTAASALTAQTLSRPVYLGSGGGGIWNANAITASTFVVNSNISGPGAFYLVDAQAGNVTTLAGTSNYSGGTYLVVGGLSIASDSNIGGASAGPLVFANSSQSPTLFVTATTNLNMPVNFWGGGTFNVASSAVVSINSALTSSYTSSAVVTKAGPGTLNLAANSPNFGQTISVTGGTLSLSSNGSLPQLATISGVSAGAVLQIDNSAINNNDRLPDQAKITLGGGTFNYSGNASVASSETFGSLALNSTSTVNVTPASAMLTSGNILSGTGTLIKAGPGTFVLGNTVQNGLSTSFTGGTNVSGGTLKLTSSSSLGFGDALKSTAPGSSLVAGGSLDLNGQTITEPITLTGGSLINSSTTPATLTSGVKAQVLTSFPAAGIGSGFSVGDSINLSGGTGSVATEALILGLSQNSFTVTGGSTTYAQSYTVSILGGGATTAATGTYNASNGKFNLSTPGSGYTSTPTLLITENYGSNASTLGVTDTPPTITFNASAFTVVGVATTNAGSGYTNAAAVTPSLITAHGTGLPANNFSTAVISSLAITGVNTIGGAGDITVNPGITGTTASLVKTGADNVTLNGTGTYTGGTTINSGTLTDFNPAGAGTGLINLSGGTLALQGGETIANNVNAPSGVSTLSIATAISANASIGAFNVLPGATVSLTSSSRGILKATALTVGGLLDVQNNGLDLPSSVGLSTVNGLVKQGFNSGGNAWQGSTGITSSTAANDTTSLTALGVIANNNGSGGALYGSGAQIASTFDGTAPNLNDILVKLTYYGDANLDGTVSSADYTLIDNGFLGGLTGWYNGDFNYDSVVNGSDYTLIDNAFNVTQGASLASQIASPTAQIAGGTTTAVPEPTSIALALVPAIALLGRRSRRR